MPKQGESYVSCAELDISVCNTGVQTEGIEITPPNGLTRSYVISAGVFSAAALHELTATWARPLSVSYLYA